MSERAACVQVQPFQAAVASPQTSLSPGAHTARLGHLGSGDAPDGSPRGGVDRGRRGDGSPPRAARRSQVLSLPTGANARRKPTQPVGLVYSCAAITDNQTPRYDDCVETPLNASATTAGALISNSTFVVPPYQREYAWEEDEVSEFWGDLREGVANESYFLGLIILTEEDDRQHVVDGQQRLLTLTMLAAALYQEALTIGRTALADRIRADFLTAIDYTTDNMQPRLRLATLETINLSGNPHERH